MATSPTDEAGPRAGNGCGAVPSDTRAEAERVQLRLLRAKSRAERLAMAVRLSSDVVRAARRAIASLHPEYSPAQVRRRFHELHYDRDSAQRVVERLDGEKMNESSDLLEAVGPVLEELSRLGVRHYVGGSIASSMHGAARSTLDVDVGAELNEDNAIRLVESLQDAYYVSREAALSAVRQRSCFNLIHLATSFKVDVFVVPDRAFDRSVLDRAKIEVVGGANPIAMPVATAEDIILLKIVWYRMGNEVSERQWSDVTQVAKLQGRQLDRRYLREWADKLAVADLLARLTSEVDQAGG